MKQLNLLKTMLLLCALIVGSNAWADDYELYSGALTEGDYIIYYDGKAMNTTTTSNRLQYTAVTPSNNIITTTNAAIEWHIAQSGDYWTIYNVSESKYAVATGTKNQATTSETLDDKALWSVSGTETYEFVNKMNSSKSVNANLRNNGTYGFACYATSTGGALSLYKKVTSDPSAPSATLSTSSLDFGKVNFGKTKTMTFTVTPANLTSDLAISCNNSKYEFTPTSIASTVTAATTVSVTANPTSLEDNMDGSITISGGGLASDLTVSLKTKVTDPEANDGSYSKPYTVAEAIEETPATGNSDHYYIKGVVSAFYNTSIMGDGTNYRYYISDDGTTTNQLLVYRGKKSSTEAFSDVDDLLVGDQVLIYGSLSTYKNAPQVDGDNYIVSLVRKEDAALVVEDDFSMEVTTTRNADDLWMAKSDGVVTFETSDATVANVAGGKLEAYKPGTATITVNVAETETFKAGSGNFVVTVTTKSAKPAEGAGVGTYILVTDASTLSDGDKLLMVGVTAGSATKTMGGQNTNNRTAIDVTISENTIAEKPEGAQEITLEGTTDAWYFNVGNGYLYAASSSNNWLRTEEEKENNAKATIAIDVLTNGATIIFQGTNTHNYLQFNNSGAGLFASYQEENTQKDVYLYRYASASTFDIEIGEAKWRTIVTAVNITLPNGVKAYKAKVSDNKVQLTEVASLKADNAYVLNGAKGVYTLTVSDSAEEPTDNELRVSTETDGNGVFVLANKTSGVGFYKWNGGALGAGRVILPASAVPNATAREFIGFGEGETTGISAMHNSECIMHNEYFDLQGRRVAQPTKGLYIVNGKKVVIK